MSEAINVRAKLLRPGARLPYRASALASGFDLYACLGGEKIVLGQVPAIVPTGLALEVPPGFDAQIRPRSGLARQGVLSTFGTLDSDYRGELMVTMYTVAPGISHTINDGDRIAQLVIVRLAEVAFEETAELSSTERGAGGHGSTGR
jgi:dUTP pyrophosphatase